MSGLESAVALVGLGAIALYAIFGGADFGGGVWDVIASGPRRAAQREAIAHAIGPVWETNHVWLIFVIVLLFSCFPAAFAALSVGLYVPLTLALVGIILRGAAYAFRSSAAQHGRMQSFWAHVFGIASIIAPFCFGAAVGGLALGGFAWTSPFALATGAVAVALCAQVAAIFLAVETDGALRDDFRVRAMIATVTLAAAGAGDLIIAHATADRTFATLVRPQALPEIGVAMLLGLCASATLYVRRFQLARVAVAVEATAILAGWYAAQAPYVIPGVLTYTDAASPPQTLKLFLWLGAIGALFLVPSLALLFHVFKRDKLEV